jgi:glycerol-3-phosphate acyltransferase PlsY
VLLCFYLFLALLIGSFPTGLVLGVYNGQDIRSVGSGNIGATNVTRVLGTRLGAWTLGLDLCKGILPVLGVRWLDAPPWYAGLVVLTVFCGHCWSLFLSFRGGKGVATGAGAMLVIAPTAMLITIGAWIGLFMGTRRSSIASLGAAGLLPIAVALLSAQWLWAALALSLGIVYRHRENVRRILDGSEFRFDLEEPS